jgi:hypothetical protein
MKAQLKQPYLVPVEGYEGRYSVTRDGRVWSHPKIWVSGGKGKRVGLENLVSSHRGKWLKEGGTGSGYKQVVLSNEFGSRRFLVHRLVAQAFVSSSKGATVVNHKNGVKADNSAENLEWCTHKENKAHAKANGLYAVGERVANAKLTAEKVIEIRRRHIPHKYPATKLAKQFGVSVSTIQNVLYRATWKHL